MSTTPYRTVQDAPQASEPVSADRELIPVFALLWMVSLLRTVLGFATAEVFGTEATIAALLTFILPILSFEVVRSALARRRGRVGGMDSSH